jgi:hypothetical protein
MLHTPERAAASEPTDVRFSIRALLVATIAVAVMAAVLGPNFRGIPAGQRMPVAALWGLCLVVTLLQVARLAWRRYRLEFAAGRRIVSAPWGGTYSGHAGQWGVFLGAGFAVGVGILNQLLVHQKIALTSTRLDQFFDFAIAPLISGTCIAFGIGLVWWQRTAQFREHGLLYGLRFMPWTHVTHWKFAHGLLMLEGVDLRHIDFQLIMRVPADQVDSVEAVFSTELPARIREIPLGAAGRSPAPIDWPRVEINSPLRITWRRAAIWAAGYAVVVPFAALRPWGTPPVAFFVGLGAGWLVMFVKVAYHRRGCGAAGPVLVRLRERLRLWPALAWIGLVVATYYSTQQLPFAHPTIMGAVGCLSGIALTATYRQSMRQDVDLCENGVIFARWTYWPWPSVDLLGWGPKWAPQLALGRGWQRLTADMSLSQRNTVAAILRLKLSAEPRTLHDDGNGTHKP